MSILREILSKKSNSNPINFDNSKNVLRSINNQIQELEMRYEMCGNFSILERLVRLDDDLRFYIMNSRIKNKS